MSEKTILILTELDLRGKNLINDRKKLTVRVAKVLKIRGYETVDERIILNES